MEVEAFEGSSFPEIAAYMTRQSTGLRGLESVPFEHRRQNAKKIGLFHWTVGNQIFSCGCTVSCQISVYACFKLCRKTTRVEKRCAHRKNEMMELRRSRRWPSGMSGDGLATEFVTALAQLEQNDRGTAARFKHPGLSDDEAAEIDAAIPLGTLWLGG
jgi:hypothetical protein